MSSCYQDECVLQTKNADPFTAIMAIAKEWKKERNAYLHMTVIQASIATLFIPTILVPVQVLSLKAVIAMMQINAAFKWTALTVFVSILIKQQL